MVVQNAHTRYCTNSQLHNEFPTSFSCISKLSTSRIRATRFFSSTLTRANNVALETQRNDAVYDKFEAITDSSSFFVTGKIANIV